MRGLNALLSFAALATAAALVTPAPTLAQQYPSKPVKIIVAYSPGGGNDFIARLMAQKLTSALGQQFIVENKPGAGGTIGFEAGVRSAPDGYTLTLISSSYTINPSLYKLRFDPVADITPIIQISHGPLLLVLNPSLPLKHLKQSIPLPHPKPAPIP